MFIEVFLLEQPPVLDCERRWEVFLVRTDLNRMRSSLSTVIRLAVLSLVLVLCPGVNAVTILSGPSFTPATNAPLAGVLQLTTDVSSRVSVLVSDGTDFWERDFYDFTNSHSQVLLGFKPGRTNLIQVTVYDKYRNEYTAPELLTFVTAPSPADFSSESVLKSVPSMMEPGYTLFILTCLDSQITYVTIVDDSGEVVWYWKNPAGLSDNDVRQLDNGDLLLPQRPPYNNFLEINMLGQTVKTIQPPAEYPAVDEHDIVPTGHGTFLYLSKVDHSVSNFPTSFTVSNSSTHTATVLDTPAVEMSATNYAFIDAWSPLDLLDPTRITYLTTGSSLVDNYHGNAVLEDTNDNSIIISLRNQNAVFKVSRAGQLKWILGPHANWKTNYAGTNLQQYLLTPVGTPFEWNYGQHAPMLTPQGTLLLYNDGNERACPWDPPVDDSSNYSCAVEYQIDETNMEVSEVWNSAAAEGDRLYTFAVGDANWLPERRNILVTYGLISYINGVHPSPYSAGATMSRIIEYTHDPVPQIVFELSFFNTNNTSSSYKGYFIYRADRISDLYPHPANPVIDFVASEQNGEVHLEFSADPAHSYEIQASFDLIHWTTIGDAIQDGDVGNFEFDDLSAGEFKDRFYRVMTQ